MTREQLEAYKSMREEIEELKSKLDHLGEGDSLIGSDVVMDYRSGYPVPQSVVGYDFNREQSLRAMYTGRKNKLEKECMELEAAVASFCVRKKGRRRKKRQQDGTGVGEKFLQI